MHSAMGYICRDLSHAFEMPWLWSCDRNSCDLENCTHNPNKHHMQHIIRVTHSSLCSNIYASGRKDCFPLNLRDFTLKGKMNVNPFPQEVKQLFSS